MEHILLRRYASPCGELLLGGYGGRLCLCDWAASRRSGRNLARLRRMLGAGCEEGASEATSRAIVELDEYFSGVRRVFSVPLLPVGTDFQLEVWRGLLSIPYGQTLTYGQQAKALGRAAAVRAVAAANGANALSIFIPCHRVVGADGSLTGYAGGVKAKRFLLGLEKALPPYPSR